MNDRYLYRAKRIDNGEWVEGNLIHAKKDYYICENPYVCMNEYSSLNGQSYGFGGFKLVDPSTICQCTGLKDKNGKLIWENDIVRYTDMITGAEKIDRIEWNETHASFARLHRSQMGLQYLNIDEYIANGCDVIGDIFDNPELLE